MRDGNIVLSPKHGLNPSILQCPMCNKETGIVLYGLLPGDKEAPRYMIDRVPCEECSNARNIGLLDELEEEK